MNRCLALICAVLLTAITLSSTCMAAPTGLLHFTLESRGGNSGRIQASFRGEKVRGGQMNWSSSFMPSDLIGMEVSSFHGASTRPIHFSMIREAGRLDCAGSGGSSRAAGDCRFSTDPGFAQLLASHGIGRLTPDQGLALIALDVRRDLIEAIASAGYPSPTVDQLTALSAVGVDAAYIRELAQAGYRPRSVQSLVEFKAMGIAPAWVRGFVQVGHAGIPASELIQLKAMGITPDFIAGFDRIGYRNIPVETLLQFKALAITPEFVRSAVGRRATMPSPQQLVEMKMFGPRGRP